MYELSIDPAVRVVLTPGDGRTYQVSIHHHDTLVTEYGTNIEPWSHAGAIMLRNIITERIPSYTSTEHVEDMVTAAFSEHIEEIEEQFG